MPLFLPDENVTADGARPAPRAESEHPSVDVLADRLLRRRRSRRRPWADLASGSWPLRPRARGFCFLTWAAGTRRCAGLASAPSTLSLCVDPGVPQASPETPASIQPFPASVQAPDARTWRQARWSPCFDRDLPRWLSGACGACRVAAHPALAASPRSAPASWRTCRLNVLHRDGHNHPLPPYIAREVADFHLRIIRVLTRTIGDRQRAVGVLWRCRSWCLSCGAVSV